MRITGAVRGAHFVGAAPLLPFGEGDSAQRAVVIGELKYVLVQVGGPRPERGVGETATYGENAIGVSGVGGESSGDDFGRALRARGRRRRGKWGQAQSRWCKVSW